MTFLQVHGTASPTELSHRMESGHEAGLPGRIGLGDANDFF